jgi:glycosyltransferase involved in cell wall biosynthesis
MTIILALVTIMAQKLLIVNYSMNENDSVFGLQKTVVYSLKTHFPKIDVLTNNSVNYVLPEGIQVWDLNWVPGNTLNNLKNLVCTATKLLKQNNYDIIFYHMTDVHAAVLSPLLYFWNRPRQVLWYAHAHPSIWLKFSSFFMDALITSTKDSFPIASKKLWIIGQAIEPKLFINKKERNYLKLKNLVHIGRLDKSKNISLIIDSVTILRHLVSEDLTLTFFGDYRSKNGTIQHDFILQKYRDAIESGWLLFQSPIPRSVVPSKLNNYDVFIHAFDGSLDKTLIEATMSLLPVVTVNKGYRKEFGSWSDDINSTLVEEFLAYFHLSQSTKSEIIRFRQKLAIRHHSFNSWINKLVAILKDDQT